MDTTLPPSYKFPMRTSMRALLLNPHNEVLLLKADDPSTTTLGGHYNGPFWFLVGGKIEDGESEEETVLREIYEESGIEKNNIQLGPIVWYGEFDLILSGTFTRQKQFFIVAHSNTTSVSLDNLTDEEKKVIIDIRWFSLKEIQESKEIIYPLCLAQHLATLLNGDYPAQPIEIDLGRNP